jgi:hypothetical protein
MLKTLLFIVCFFGFSAEAIAQGTVLHKELIAAEFELNGMNSQEALDRLEVYKKDVESTAYTTTLQLCEGYRRSADMGPHPYHGRYMFSEADAMLAWAKVITHGTMNSFSAINGLKADYIQVENLGLFDFNAWFNSVHSIFLINSSGFLKGAMHCLDSIDASEINKLAAAIVIADQEATLAVELGLTFSAGRVLMVLGKVISKSRWAINLDRFLKMRIPATVRYPVSYTVKGAAAIGIGTFLYRKVQAKFAAQAKAPEIERMLLSEDSKALDMQLLLVAFEKLQAANEQELLATDGLSADAKKFLYADFSDYLAKNIDPKTEVRLLLELRDFRKQNPSISYEEMPPYYLFTEVVFLQKSELRNL